MADGKEIKFRYGEASVQLNKDNKFLYQNDKGNKLRAGLQNIFNAIKNVKGQKGKLDAPEEMELLDKLQSIFSADGDDTISEDEMMWAKGFAGGDVVEFIETKYNEAVVAKNAPEQEPLPEDEEISLNYGNPYDYAWDEELDGENKGITEYSTEVVTGVDEDENPIVDKQIEGYSVYIDGIGEVYASTLEEIKKLKLQIEEEQDKIKGSPVGEETDEEMTARYAQNMQVIATIAKLADYDKTVISNLLENYMNDTDRVDKKSPEYNSFARSLLGTRDPGIIKGLELVEYGDFKGDEATFRKYASLYKELREKELNGEKLSDEEKDIRNMLSYDVVMTTYDFGLDEDENDYIDLFMNFDGKGNVCYIGEWTNFRDGTVSPTIAGKTRETVENFQNEYKEVLQELDEISDPDEKEIARAEKFRELYHKYASVENDDSFACSVLTSSLIEYAAPEDVQMAIDKNGAEFLMYLSQSLYYQNFSADRDDNAAIKNQLQISITERAMEIYTETDKGNPFNMKFLPELIDLAEVTTFAEDEEENNAIAQGLKDKLLESYFEPYKYVPQDCINMENPPLFDGFKYNGRRLTVDEAEAFVELLKNNEQTDMIMGLLDALKPEDIATDEWGAVVAIAITDKDSSLDENVLTGIYANMIGEMEYKEDVRSLIRNIADIDGQKRGDNITIPFDTIMEREDCSQYVDLLLGNCTKEAIISDENRIELIIYCMAEEDGQYIVDREMLKKYDVGLVNLINTLPDNIMLGSRNENDKVFNAIFDEVKIGDNDSMWQTLYESVKLGDYQEIFTRKFLDKLSDNLSADNIMRADKLISEVMKVNPEHVKKAGAKFVDSAVKNIDMNVVKRDASVLTELIKFCGKYGINQAKIMMKLDISELSEDDKKAVQNAMFENFFKGSRGDGFNAAMDNGWFNTVETISSYNKGRTINDGSNMYRMGDYEFELIAGILVRPRSAKGVQAGLDIYDGVRGWNTPNGAQHRTAVQRIDDINKNSVVDTIMAFNRASDEYGKGREIMRFLNSESGITVETMLKIPQALVEWGKEIGIDTSELEALISQAGYMHDTNFPKGLADKLDDAMIRLIYAS